MVETDRIETIADGVAGRCPIPEVLDDLLVLLDDVVLVRDDSIKGRMRALYQAGRSRQPHVEPPSSVLSGGNVDAGLLASVARRHETEAGRRLGLFTRVPDRPGGLVDLLSCVASTGGNIVDVSHVREGVDLHVRETGVQLVLETRGRDHAAAVLQAVLDAGYAARVMR